MDSITQTLQALRQLTQVSIQEHWHGAEVQLLPSTQPDGWQAWAIAALNAKGHIAWPQGRQDLWLVQAITVPDHLQGYSVQELKLYLALTWWAEQAEIFVNGDRVQVGDLFDCSARILLSGSAQPGTVYTVSIHLVSPGHDPGALVRSLLMFESPDDPAFWEPSFIADELHGLQTYLQTFEPDHIPQLTDALAQLDWSLVSDRPRFDQHLTQLREQLHPLAKSLQERQIHLVGHAHLDLAWLWPIAETWDAAERTFQSVLGLQTEFPELIFCHSSPALFEWLELNRPELFQAIQAKVAAGTFEITAGLWVEPELNLIDGESIARQILYGQQYVQAKFGALNRVAWLPDTFGFCWQLPQLLRLGGVDYFVTQKLRWNDTTQFPYDAFWWRSPDGTAIFSLMSALIGQDLNPIKMTDYVWDWEQKTQIPDALWLPGVGDHGGGPTRDMLQTARRWQQSAFFPHLQFSTVLAYLQRLQPHPTAPPPTSGETALNTETSRVSTLGRDYPVWESELYLEFHRGCYTTHADQKRLNRHSEVLLYQAELYASLATLVTGCPYPQTELTGAWKDLLFNQFHDILPGSSIPEVFVDANQTWQALTTTGHRILTASLQQIMGQIQLPPPPQSGAIAIAVFNPLPWPRTEVVSAPDSGRYKVCDDQGISVPYHVSRVASQHTTLFLAEVPGFGYRVYWLSPQPVDQPSETVAIPLPTTFVLENEHLRVTLDPKTGNIASLTDRGTGQEVLREPGNQLQCFQDQGQYWDAWNIDPNYEQHPLPPPQLLSIQWLESSEVRQRVRVVRTFQQSRFQQDYVLDTTSQFLKIETVVDWQERHVLVKAAFPLNLEDAIATYETPFAAITRPNDPKTPAEKAMWEVPALRWADVGNGDSGVSLLNDCKYGYDCQGSQLRLTLLRGSVWPDPAADLGHHTFTYAVYPHRDRWPVAQVVQQGHRLNQPLLTQRISISVEQSSTSLPNAAVNLPKPLPPRGQFLSPWPENLVLSAWKRSESNPQDWVLRCYEAHGQSTQLRLTSPLLSLSLAQPVDLLERPVLDSPSPHANHPAPDLAHAQQTSEQNKDELAMQQDFWIRPWQVCTFKVSLLGDRLETGSNRVKPGL